MVELAPDAALAFGSPQQFVTAARLRLAWFRFANISKWR
jgi:hypothetical protein